eukprot:gene18925-24732_t
MSNIVKQPVFFLSHGGGPSFFMDAAGGPFEQIDKNSKSKEFLSNLSQYIPNTPRAIVVVSAHWEENVVSVQYQRNGTALLYDYYGFPEYTYAPHLTYPAPTDISIADDICKALQSAGIKYDKVDRGFDHGVFIPLKLIYPDANIPIIQVSLQKNLDIKEHINLGKALSPLREQGVLIIGSGQATHNLSEIRLNANSKSILQPAKWAIDFTDWVHQTLSKINNKEYSNAENDLVNIMSIAPNARKAHPRTEHLVPLFVAYGAAIGNNNNQDVKYERIHNIVAVESMSLDSYLFH